MNDIIIGGFITMAIVPLIWGILGIPAYAQLYSCGTAAFLLGIPGIFFYFRSLRSVRGRDGIGRQHSLKNYGA